ncbi:putative transmembrane protein [Tieghemostelium lacteum]|uniref:Putative transmembrane protein n=1 Tax=Tieghemostelium lacteum TaxID=361077 RepID=A0A151ZFJ8_TIELA|nr:putative transmembrane protein [Tieghemostelium lacteum]|eukprot:KYQ92752.1 putative transmembrane protein [Tieghemostelium lacteum]
MIEYYYGIFLIQFIGYLQSALFKSERYYDVYGSISFLIMSLLSYLTREELEDQDGNQRSDLLLILMVIWSARLGFYLNDRIQKNQNQDKRFNGVRDRPMKLFIYWFIQSLWVCCLMTPIFILNNQPHDQNYQKDLSFGDYLLILCWVLSFLTEVVADIQKTLFISANANRFIASGLWKHCRHPNYLAEIIMHTITYLIFLRSHITHYSLLGSLGAIFTWLLMVFISTPTLEAMSDKKFQKDPLYQLHKKSTFALIPFFY